MGIVMIAGILAGAAYAQTAVQSGAATPGYGPGGCPLYGANNSNLTAAQRTELDKLRQDFQNDTAEIRNELRDKRRELHELLRTSNPDPAKATALQQEISGLDAQLDQRQLQLRLEARKIAPAGCLGPGYGGGYGAGNRGGAGTGRNMMGGGYGQGGCRY